MVHLRSRLILIFAALWGMAGVIMLAAGSHAPQAGLMATGGQVLLFHAAAVVGLTGTPLVTGYRLRIPALLLLVGSGLFGAEIALHVLTGVLSFAFLAPIGGVITILGWLLLAICAAVEPKPA